jgi:hypothetical protein
MRIWAVTISDPGSRINIADPQHWSVSFVDLHHLDVLIRIQIRRV